MDRAIAQRLSNGAERLGTPLTADAVARLERYLALLLEWNRVINLTAITAPVDVVELHFLDSLAVAPLVDGCATLVDVGSGAGFPGAVLAIVRPDLRVTCIDGVAKKVAFLQTLRRTVAPNLEPLHQRDDALRAAGRHFDAAVSRATWDPAEWLTHGAPLVAPGGRLIAMQTADAPELTAPAGFAALPPVHYRVAEANRRLQPFLRL